MSEFSYMVIMNIMPHQPLVGIAMVCVTKQEAIVDFEAISWPEEMFIHQFLVFQFFTSWHQVVYEGFASSTRPC